MEKNKAKNIWPLLCYVSTMQLPTTHMRTKRSHTGCIMGNLLFILIIFVSNEKEALNKTFVLNSMRAVYFPI